MRGITLAEHGHFVNLIPPVDATGGTNGDIFSMAKWSHASIVVLVGASAAAFASIKLSACDDAAGNNPEAIDFAVYKEETAAGDLLGARVEAVAATGVVPDAADNIMYVIELDAAALPDAKPWVRLEIANSTNSVLLAAVAILTGGRYAGPESPTVLS